MCNVTKKLFSALLMIIFCCISKIGFSQSKNLDSNKNSKNHWTWKGKSVTEKQLKDSMGILFDKYVDSINKADRIPAKKTSIRKN